MKNSALKIDILETLDQESLDRLRRVLDLTPRGRLSDDWDYKFGYRVLEGDGAEATDAVLWRADGSPWHIEISYSAGNRPSGAELAKWRKEIIDGIKAAGLTPSPDS